MKFLTKGDAKENPVQYHCRNKVEFSYLLNNREKKIRMCHQLQIYRENFYGNVKLLFNLRSLTRIFKKSFIKHLFSKLFYFDWF